GLKIKKWTTFHGFSINVNNDLKYFDNITACGLKGYPQTSIKKILKKSIPIYDVKEQLRDSFGNIFKIPVLRII
ncbi:MAG: lipoyl(octanoyl) transferase, partial [Actinobacteria bacterium]|nr:lipoyl(octanoyl) transferase [Actinomycetota bacterium]